MRRFTSGGRSLICAAAIAFSASQLRAAGFIDRGGTPNNEGYEIGGAGVGDRMVITDEIPGGPITTVFWRIGGANDDLFETSPGVRAKSTAAPAGAQAAIQNAFNTIQAQTNFLFVESTNAARWNNLPGPGGHGQTIDIYFADLDTDIGPNVLGGASTSNAVGAAAGGVFTATNVDLSLNNKLGVYNPAAAPAGYSPVVNPLVHPYGTFTGSGNSAIFGDIESVVLHEVMHALGLQHPDRTIQNINSDVRFTRNYDTSVSGSSVVHGRSLNVNEDDLFLSGLIRMQGGAAAAVAGEPFSVYPNFATSAVMTSTSGGGDIKRTITPDDLKGLAWNYQDLVAQSNAEFRQGQTATQYVGITIESDWSKVAGTQNTWNDDPSQTTRNDLRANAQDLGSFLPLENEKVVGSIAGRTSGAQSTTGDVDYYKIEVPADYFLRLDIDEGVDVGNGLDTLIRLLKLDGTEITSADTDTLLDSDSKSGSLDVEDPALVYWVGGTEAQTFLIKVESVMFTPVGGGASFNDEGDYVLDITVAVPEPAGMLMLGAMAMLAIRRRR